MIYYDLKSGCIQKCVEPEMVLAGIILRLLVIPSTFVAMASLLPISGDLKTVLYIQAGMPSAVLPIVLVRQYGGDLQLAIRIIVSTSVLCLLTMPAWLSLVLGTVTR